MAGLGALLDCNEQVTIAIRNHLDHVADYLRKKGIIDLKLYRAATDTKSLDSTDTRARNVCRRLQDMVESDEKYYGIFMEYLRSDTQKFENITKTLDKAYVDNGGSLPSGGAVEGSARDQQPSSASVSKSNTSAQEMKAAFSDKFTAAELADWMAKNYQLSDEACKIMTSEGITGHVFTTLKDDDIKELNFNFGARRTLTSVLKEIQSQPKPKSDEPAAQTQDAPSGSRTELDEQHYSQLCEQLSQVKTSWADIARSLGFHPNEIAEIQSNPMRMTTGDYIYGVIEFYLRWAPGDKRGSKDVATLEELQRALNKNNFARIKLKITD